MADHDWNERYRLGDTPWDTGSPEEALVAFVEQAGLADARVLEVGCGTGTNALWLASRGFDVVGIDVSDRAIDLARAKAAQAPGPGTGRFEIVDFLATQPDGGPFDLVFDRGVFHGFDAADARARFASQVAASLVPGGRWLSLIGSTEGAPREEGPPRRSARDIVNAIEPVLEIVDLRTAAFDTTRSDAPRAWRCLSRLRLVPAQPSTVRT
ncbi:MAG: class I SAM-dependent methyltransferase [Acidobacteria bacterium]|nr:class I SAM-dependent methyltransferase [Acidobacteriota bacterium]